MGNLSLDIQKLIKFNPSEVEFTENAKIGWKTKEGDILIPAEYDQIEKCATSLYLRQGLDYEILKFNGEGEAYLHNYDKGSFFVENQKYGWRTADKIIIPAFYDEIDHWSDNVFPVVKDGRHYYINENQEEILTNIRHPEIIGEDEFPFTCNTHDKRVLTVFEYVGHQEKKDSNVVKLDTWVKLERISNQEIMDLLINPEDEAPITEKDLEFFNSESSYEFTAYKAKSTAKEGINDCLDMMEQMGAFSRTWYYIIKVWKSEGESPTADELRYLRYLLESKGSIGRPIFALAHDYNLNHGETKLFMLTFYNEGELRSLCAFDWYDFLNRHTLSETNGRLTILGEINEYEDIEYINEALWNRFDGEIENFNYSPKKSWEDAKRVLDFLKQYDNSYKHIVYNIVSHFFSIFELNTKDYDEFLLNKIKWLLDNGANVNVHERNETSLDLIQKYTSGEEEDYYNANSVERCINLLRQHGGKTMEEIMIEEAKNNDYRIEIEKIREGQ